MPVFALRSMRCGVAWSMLIWAGACSKSAWHCRERGKSGSVRTLLAFKHSHHVFFVYGFAKSARANISDAELKALRRLADELLSYADTRIDTALGAKELIEVVTDDE